MSSIPSESTKLFEPAFQAAYWSALDPDLRVFLDEFEMKESWTYDYNELPGLYTEIAGALPKIATKDMDEQTASVLKDLYPLLASMSFRLCVTAISWLDRNVKDQSQFGWGVIVFLEAAKLANDPNVDEQLASSARMVYDRVRIIMMTRLAVKIFTNIPRQK